MFSTVISIFKTVTMAELDFFSIAFFQESTFTSAISYLMSVEYCCREICSLPGCISNFPHSYGTNIGMLPSQLQFCEGQRNADLSMRNPDNKMLGPREIAAISVSEWERWRPTSGKLKQTEVFATTLTSDGFVHENQLSISMLEKNKRESMEKQFLIFFLYDMLQAWVWCNGSVS